MLKHFICVHFALTTFLMVLIFVPLGFSQVDLAQQAYAIFEQSCLNCHGEHGAFTEAIIIDYTALIETGVVVAGKPGASELYQRLIEKRVEKRMPLGQPPLSRAAINTIRGWILAGAPSWETLGDDVTFITPKEMLEAIEQHVNSLSVFDRTYARYFTLMHLYNAGEMPETLHAYQRTLSKLVNSLSWGRKVIKPKPIDPEETIFYIDLRDYEWEIGRNRWTQIEAVYPYKIDFNAPTQTVLREKLLLLREAMDCEVPFVDVDWFLATASLPPLYYDILDLPETDRELEARLEVDVVENIRNAAGKRVWRAGFNDSRVSNNNRVVERHLSRYGAYWKSYDFAGSVGTQNIFTHPLSFEHDGGEIIFNLPNGLQAYYLADAGGNRLDAAPINIVSNPAASDPTVRNGLSCMGCHTEGIKDFEDQVRAVVKKTSNPPFDKDRALRLYTEKATMDALLDEDTRRYRQSLEVTGDVFGGIEPVQRFHEAFQAPLDAADAAAAVGLETGVFLGKIRENVSLENLLGALALETGTVKRDAWTSIFHDVISALNTPESVLPPVVERPERIPGDGVYIPDPNLRAAIAEVLGKAPDAPITAEEMAAANFGNFHLSERISDLTGLEYATTLVHFSFGGNEIPDLSPLADLKDLYSLYLSVSDLSLLTSRLADAGLTGLRSLGIKDTNISDISPFTDVGLALTGLRSLSIRSTNVSDISPLAELAGLTELTALYLTNNNISDISPLAELTGLNILYLDNNNISDISPLAELTALNHLGLGSNNISDISPLAELIQLSTLELDNNNISDVSPLVGLTRLNHLALRQNNISDISPLKVIRHKTGNVLWYNNPGFPEGGPPIEGSLLWVAVPGGSGIDSLARASNNAVTELRIATSGATVGSPVGENVWRSHKVEGDHRHIGTTLTAMANDVLYSCIFVDSPRHQETMLFVPDTYMVEVWFNGVWLHHSWRSLGGGSRPDYVNFFPVTLKAGKNVLLSKFVGGSISGFFGFALGTEYTASIQGMEYTFSHPIIYVGDTFTLDLSARNVIDLAGWQFEITFDPAVFEAIAVSEGDFLNLEGDATFFQKGSIDNARGKITKLSSVRLSAAGVSGTGTLLLMKFTAKTAGETLLKLENFQLAAISGESIPAGPHEVIITVEGKLATGDVNRDGQVSILDMVLVARQIGKTVSANSEVDVNSDGIISILDLIIVASHLGESTAAAAPAMLAQNGIHDFNPAIIQAWIEQAELENDGSVTFQQGIAKLQKLLASLIPEETVLLANYPNPFNPETWIPYELSEPADVALTIYAIDGQLVRTLALGHQPAGVYQSRSRAVYWDGRNEVGEPVASGLYFYTLTAGDYIATRKLVIRK